MKVILLIISLFLMSCSEPLEKTLEEKLEVPFEEQVQIDWCVPASVLMCAKYFANEVGWYDPTFEEYDSGSQQNFINTKLKEYGGTTFYEDSQEGAPKSISRFMYNYLNITNTNMAKIKSTIYYDEDIGVLGLIREQILYNEKPLIAVIKSDEIKTHAVVVTGYEEILKTNEISKIYYNDPWFGKTHELRKEWEEISKLSDRVYITLYFNDYYN